LLVEGTRLHRLQRDYDSSRFWGGPDFSRAAKSLKTCRALAPGVSFSRLRDFFCQPPQPCPSRAKFCRCGSLNSKLTGKDVSPPLVLVGRFLFPQGSVRFILPLPSFCCSENCRRKTLEVLLCFRAFCIFWFHNVSVSRDIRNSRSRKFRKKHRQRANQ
jgi:hypothetical protein